MGKATANDLIAAGFRHEQFGVADAGGFDAYLAPPLAFAEAWAKDRYGSGYDAVASPTIAFHRLQKAELYKSSAELWRNRVAFVDSNAMQGREGFAYLDRRECLAHATACDEQAELWIQQAIAAGPVVPGSLLSTALTETGRFPQAVNGSVVPS